MVISAASIGIGRDAARELTRRELSKPEYHRDDPSLVQRAATWAKDRILDLLAHASGISTGGWLGIVVILGLVALVVVVVLRRVGGVRRNAARTDPLMTGRVLGATEHRTNAETAAAAGQFAEAIRERLRAIVRELETRGVIDTRPGRTADELAADAGRALPQHADALRAATRVFDDVWYGARPATAAGYAIVRGADDLVREARTFVVTP